MNHILYQVFKKGGIPRKIIQRIVVRAEGGSFRSVTLRKLYKQCFNVDVGIGSYGWESGLFNGPAVIGKYCSIGPGVRRYGLNHCITSVTSHPCVFNPVYGWVDKDFREPTQITIGNDVWIGAGAIILPSCNQIGNGAIIGAGSVVTKNVGEYEIFAGAPAKKIGERFNSDIIERITKTEWWNLPEDVLKEYVHDMRNPEIFLKKIEGDGGEI